MYNSIYRKEFLYYPMKQQEELNMKVKNWVKFILLSILVFATVLVITYGSQIWNAIKVFPMDRLISYILGAATMFLAGIKFREKEQKSDEEE